VYTSFWDTLYIITHNNWVIIRHFSAIHNFNIWNTNTSCCKKF
jgi:hypothetical protein